MLSSALISFFMPLISASIGLNLEKRTRVKAKRQVSVLQSSNQFREVFDSLLATNEDLNATRITDNVGLSILVDPLVEVLAT